MESNDEAVTAAIESYASQLATEPTEWSPPRLFDLADVADRQELLTLLSSGQVRQVRDESSSFAEELAGLDRPGRRGEGDSAVDPDRGNAEGRLSHGVWVWFPWSRDVVRVPRRSDLLRLRSDRNRFLITSSEQERLSNASIAVAGLSVGSSVVDALVMTGIGDRYLLGDMDVLAVTNLNRVRAGVVDVGESKVSLIAKRVSELDPYIEQVHVHEPIGCEALRRHNDPRPFDLIVDEVDDIAAKLSIRRFAEERGIPVIMATDVADKAFIDIERYDLGEGMPFHGQIAADRLQAIERGEVDARSAAMTVIDEFIGPDQLSLRAVESLRSIGQELVTWPQLGKTAMLAGAAVAHYVTAILLGERVSGRYMLGW